MKVKFKYDRGLLYGFEFLFSTCRTWTLYLRKYENRLEFQKGVLEAESHLDTHTDMVAFFKCDDDNVLCKFAMELLSSKATEELWKSLMHVERDELEAFFNPSMVEAIKVCAGKYVQTYEFVKYVGSDANGLKKDFLYLVTVKGDGFTKVSDGRDERLVSNNFLEFI